MGQLITLNFAKRLPFSIGSWLLTQWPLNSAYFGIMNNSIGHSSSTSFEITAKWEYIKITYITQSEYNYDYATIYKNGTSIKSFKGNSQNTVGTWEYTNFDGSECTLKFTYAKDSSQTVSPDAFMILSMQVQTADNSIKQTDVRYALKCPDGIYSIDQDQALVKMADDLETITPEMWLEQGALSTSIAHIRNEITGPKPSLLQYETSEDSLPLTYTGKCLYPPNLVKENYSHIFDMDYIVGIQNFVVTKTEGELDRLKFLLSNDDGATWCYYRGDMWVYCADDDLTDDYILQNGMESGELESIPQDAFNELAEKKKLRVCFILRPGSITSELKLNKFECNYVLLS